MKRAVFAMLVLLGVLAPAAAAQQPTRTVVLVSGFTSNTPFSTPDPQCLGQEGGSWGGPDGLAPALKAAGFQVFTMPERAGRQAPPASCAPGAQPPSNLSFDTKGRIDVNGRKLVLFLDFLRDQYDVQRVQLVGHSDGGLWSRSAIAQKPKVPVDGLATLGTLHNGSFVADLGTELTALGCQASDPACTAVQKLARGIVANAGADATDELGSIFMVGWNERREIGPCRVTVFQGTAANAPPPPAPQQALPDYYVPSDGLVGLSSAAAVGGQRLDGTTIPAPDLPGLVDGGASVLWHTPQLGNPSELNDPPLNRQVAAALSAPGEPCAGSVKRRRTANVTLPFNAAETTPAGGAALPATKQSDVVYALGEAEVQCDGRTLSPAPLLPVPPTAVKAVVPGPCANATTTGLALLVRQTAAAARISITGRKMTVTARGVRDLKVQYRQPDDGGKGDTDEPGRRGARQPPARYRTLTLGPARTATIPRGETAPVRLTGTVSGDPVSAAGLISR